MIKQNKFRRWALAIGLLSLFLAVGQAAASDSLWLGIIDRAKQQNGKTRSVEARLELAIAYANTGRLEAALQEFQALAEVPDVNEKLRTVIEKEPRRPDSTLWVSKMAFANYCLFQHELAARYFEMAVKLDPDNVWIRHFTALTYYKVDDMTAVFHHLEQAREIDPDNEFTHLLLGMAFYEKKDYLRAVYHYLKAPHARKVLSKYL